MLVYKEHICGIYCIENLINCKKYIGQSKHIKHRWAIHKWDLSHNKHCNQHLQKAWNRYGKSNFTFYILEECEMANLDSRELYYISLYNSCDSSFGYNIEIGGGGKKEISKETREKISRSAKLRVGEKNPFYGRHHSIETKRMIGKANSMNWKGKFGFEHNKSMPVYCVDLHKTFGSSREAEKETGADHTSISRCCRNLQKTAGGHTWKYVDEVIHE